MTTKEQERKALEQIKKIVAGLGEGSYVGMAFEGCFEIAEDNIGNDFGCSMKQRAESAERRVEELKFALEQAQGTRKHVEERFKEVERARDENFREAKDAYDRLRDMKALADEQERAKVEVIGQLEAFKDILEDKETEIVRLKAKLYDLMTK